MALTKKWQFISILLFIVGAAPLVTLFLRVPLARELPSCDLQYRLIGFSEVLLPLYALLSVLLLLILIYKSWLHFGKKQKQIKLGLFAILFVMSITCLVSNTIVLYLLDTSIFVCGEGLNGGIDIPVVPTVTLPPSP